MRLPFGRANAGHVTNDSRVTQGELVSAGGKLKDTICFLPVNNICRFRNLH